MTARVRLCLLFTLCAACGRSNEDGELPIDGETMSTTVFVANHTSGLLTAEWNDDLVTNPEANVGSPLDIPSGETLEVGTDWDWGRLPVADIAPELTVVDGSGVVLYELPDESEGVPDDPRWTTEDCGYPGPCRYTLTIEE